MGVGGACCGIGVGSASYGRARPTHKGVGQFGVGVGE